MVPLERDEFIGHMDLIHDGLKTINGRLGVVEQDVAVLKDRSESTQDAAKAQAKLTAGRWGMLLAGLGAGMEIVRQWWGR